LVRVLLALIVVCEVLFWIFLGAGLATRYLLRRPRTGAVLLAAAPVVDLVLLVASVADLRAGGAAGTAHVLAAIYIGVSIGFGHRMVRWADVRFAHRFAGGPAPAPRPRWGREHARVERSGWFAHLLAWAVGSTLMLAAVVATGDAERTEAFTHALRLWTVVVVADGVWSLSYSVFPRRSRTAGQMARWS
jgi:hypothetical protein